MNRFKKELRKRGLRLACDYKSFPAENGIAGVIVITEMLQVRIFHMNTGWHYYDFDSKMKATEVT